MLQGKNILVAGAGGLLGTKLVERLLDEGAHVVAADLDESLLRKRLTGAGVSLQERLETVQVDLNDAKQVSTLFESAIVLDGAVNCAYPRNKQYGRSFFDVELQDFNENVSLHLGASFLFIQSCAKYFKEKQTTFSLVNISSIYGVIAPKFELYKDTSMTTPVEYAAIKSALVHLSKYVVSFVADSRFRSNCVSPGGLFDHQPEIFLKRYQDACLGKGMLSVDDVLGSIVFLLSDQSLYVNAQNLVVDDGFTL